MNWVDALDKLLKLKGIYDKAKEVKKVYDYGEKLKKKKPDQVGWDDLKFFSNKQMTEATANVDKAIAAADAALGAAMEWPKSESGKIFIEALKLSEKHKTDSPQVAKKLDDYRNALKVYDMQLATVKARLVARNADIDAKIELAGNLAEYCKGLEEAFMKIAQIPSLGGTAQNAMFFSLGQDASQLKGRSYTLKARLAKVKEKNAKLIAEAETKIGENRLWMEWAKSRSPAKEGNLKSNERAKKPKK